MDVDWIIIHVATFSRATRICIRIISFVLSAMIFRIRSCRAINNVSNDILERAGKKGEQHIVAPIFWSSSYREFRISLLAAKLGVFYIQPIRVEKIFPQTLCFMTRNRLWKWRWIARSFIWWMIGAQFSRKKNLFFRIKLTVLGQGSLYSRVFTHT